MEDAQPGDVLANHSAEDRTAPQSHPDRAQDSAVAPGDAGKSIFGKNLFAVRPPKQEDMGLIFETWIWGMYDGNAWLKEHLSRDHFWQLYRGVLQGLLSSPDTGVLILCLSDDPDTVIGYLVGSAPNVIHWIFIKKHFQKHGLGHDLLKEAQLAQNPHVIATHMTDTSRAKFPKGWEFKPYLLR